MLHINHKCTEDTIIMLSSAQRIANLSTAWLYAFYYDSVNVVEYYEWLGFAIKPPNYRNKNNKLVLGFRDVGGSATGVQYPVTVYVRNYDENDSDGFFTWNKVNAVTKYITLYNTYNALRLEFDVPSIDKDFLLIKVYADMGGSSDTLYMSHAYIVSRDD